MADAERVEVAVNARFAGRATTGVERYAAEITRRLADRMATTMVTPSRPVHGAVGHAWEQMVLPGRFRRTGAPLLLSPCNTGPVGTARQLVVMHDAAPFLHPSTFTPAYGRQIRTVQQLLARRCAVATVSQRSRTDLARTLDLAPDDIAVVPCAVGPPFTDPATSPTAARTADPVAGGPARAVVVGGHDPRKNVAFLLRLWPRVHRRHGAELHVVARSATRTLRGAPPGGGAGVVWHHDLDDAALAGLYRSAAVLLSPSRYEGFGLPLLEAMACGTPFLSSDAGAARELAVYADRQVLPLDPDAWVQQLDELLSGDQAPLRRASRAAAGRWTWDASAAALASAVMHASAR